MLPGKKYTPEDFVWMAWRRKWLIAIPAVLAAVGTFVWSYQLPDRYSASTTILVVPQRVPEAFVRSTITVDVAERLQAITQQILSRTRLEQIIQEFNLYREERETMIMEDIVEQMRTRDIKVDVASPRRRGQDASHFAVKFESSQPRMAMQVAERLASMFVQENLQDRGVLVDQTNQFLQAQLEDARRRLVEHESKLEAFRQRNAGQLPAQAGSNLQMMQMTQTQIQANIEAANRDRDRLSGIDAAIAETIGNVSQAPAERTVPAGVPTGTPAQQLEQAQAALTNLERRGLKPTHPDVTRTKRVIADLEIKVAEAATRQAELASLAMPEKAVNVPASVASKVTALRLEADRLRKSLETRKSEDERLRGLLASYNFRLEAAPKLESELTELMRDYQTLQTQYESLLRKAEESKLAVNLERRQIGEQFKIIEGARLPQRPISPDRTRMNLMGLIAGLGFGIALVGLLEYRDTTLKTDDDIVVSLALPVLAVIPAMMTQAERRRAKRKRLLLAASASFVFVLAAGAVAAWRMNLLTDWIR
jgi:polysaccharide chain length determinant protein (PEP-CTERM system associated)